MRKRSGCLGCPWYKEGEGFVPDDIPCGERTQVLFIAQNPGEVEEIQAKPLAGVTGQMFKGRFVGKHLPGVPVGYANVVKCRKVTASGAHMNTMPSIHSHEWKTIRDNCAPYLAETVAAVPNAILVPLGEYAAQAVTGLKAKAMVHLRGTVLCQKDF